jgi:putative transcriptional regulator
MADRKISLNELAKRIELTDSNLSIFKTGKARAVRILTLDALCRELHCQPGDLLEYQPDDQNIEDVKGEVS